MINLINGLLVTSSCLGCSFVSGLLPLPVRAEIPERDLIAQVNLATQFSDVQPSDAYFQALQLLAERYGVMGGYPDGTFRGNSLISTDEYDLYVVTANDRLIEIGTSCGFSAPDLSDAFVAVLHDAGAFPYSRMTRGEFAISLALALDFLVWDVMSYC